MDAASDSDNSDIASSDGGALSSGEEEALDEEILASQDSDSSSDSGGEEHVGSDVPEANEPVRGRGRGRGATGRGRGAVRGLRGRGAGGRGGTANTRGRGRGHAAQPMYARASGYDDIDAGGPAQFPTFQPSTPSGLKLPDDFSPQCEADFFKLYFPIHVVDRIVEFTNAYARAHIHQKKSYAMADGTWKDTTTEEMYSFMAILLYQGWHTLPEIRDYWKTSSLYAGNYGRLMIPSRSRFEALLCFLKIVDHTAENPADKLRKVRFLNDHMKSTCRKLFKPGQFVAIDERMVRCKGRSSFIQYLPNKPVKWGFKIFASCDSATSILCDFEVYTGQADVQGGLAHNVVVRLSDGLEKQNYVIFTDNFYTSAQLADTLLGKGIYLVGTIRSNRRGFPRLLKDDMKKFEKKADRGETRYVRDGNKLYQQWKDKRVVSMLSTVHKGHEHVTVARKSKADGQFQVVQINQPKCIGDYNSSMGGVDLFDQHIAAYRALRRCQKYWKSIFLDFLDVSEVNAFLMFEIWRKSHPGQVDRPKHHRRNDFRGNLICQLAGIDVDEAPPKRAYRSRSGTGDAQAAQCQPEAVLHAAPAPDDTAEAQDAPPAIAVADDTAAAAPATDVELAAEDPPAVGGDASPGPAVDDVVPAEEMHLATYSEVKKNCVWCWKAEKKQRQVVTYCRLCGEFLHVSQRNCFVLYHESKPFYR